jgi:hypothetical protein
MILTLNLMNFIRMITNQKITILNNLIDFIDINILMSFNLKIRIKNSNNFIPISPIIRIPLQHFSKNLNGILLNGNLIIKLNFSLHQGSQMGNALTFIRTISKYHFIKQHP